MAVQIKTSIAMDVLQKATWHYISSVPRGHKSAATGQWFPTSEAMMSIWSALSLKYDPNLLSMIEADAPPTEEAMDDIQLVALLDNSSKLWADYILVLKKDGSETLLYGGSGLRTLTSVRAREVDYNSENALPDGVAQALKAGYKLTMHACCWADTPPPELRPAATALMLAIEGTLSSGFGAVKDNNTVAHKSVLQSFTFWPGQSFPWKGLCSHSSLKEVKPSGLSAEELTKLHENLINRMRESARIRTANYRKRHKDRLHEERVQHRNENRDFLNAQNNASRKIRVAKNPQGAAKKRRESGKKAVREGRFPCPHCGWKGRDNANLRQHLGRNH
ncbi:Hypothetical protein D9617_17g047050 [Elsinoe fawcettii]|nr:Hypothetical protein D9617_17g047050 [Elsinoe fawcettii]